MPLPLKCDWCLKEEVTKIKRPRLEIQLPKGWDMIPENDKLNPSEVIVSCSQVCKKQLVDARAAIHAAREERRELEEKKKKGM